MYRDIFMAYVDIALYNIVLPYPNSKYGTVWFVLIFQCDPDTTKAMLDVGWGRVKEASKAETYWDIFVAYVDMAFQPCVLGANPDSDIGQSLSKVERQKYY